MLNQAENTIKTSFTSAEVPVFVFDMHSTLKEIQAFPEVDSVYMNPSGYKLEFYIYYDKENFEVEDKITKKITDFEMTYKYFPEVFIYPLNMIESKELTLPKTAKEI